MQLLTQGASSQCLQSTGIFVSSAWWTKSLFLDKGVSIKAPKRFLLEECCTAHAISQLLQPVQRS
jgi:hypothetical protein